MDNSSTPLAKYKQNKKTLTPPLATLPFKASSWIDARLPEMLWAVLIRIQWEGEDGYRVFREITQEFCRHIEHIPVRGITLTDIANTPVETREKIIQTIVDKAGAETLQPLLLFTGLPALESWQRAISIPGKEEDISTVAWSVAEVLPHQSQFATDIRWVKLIGTIAAERMSMPQEMLENINFYPDKGDQRSVRPSIRSAEITDDLLDPQYVWATKFWEFCYENTSCMPEKNESKSEEISGLIHNLRADREFYVTRVSDSRDALIDHFFKTSNTTKVDSRHESIFGIALYMLDVFLECAGLELASGISGRVTLRIMMESYVTLKYLFYKEKAGDDSWDSYRDYGLGQLNLINKKYEEQSLTSSLVDREHIGYLANEDKWAEFVPINIGHWDELDLRKICVKVGEKKLYDMFYSYSSGYVHGSWGAVRESAMQSCLNPLHRLHRIPSFQISLLPNPNEECRKLLNKAFALVDKGYPHFKSRIRKRPEPKKGS